jgi:prephenate dehydrogenase
MWTDICRANRTHILEDLEAFIGNLKNIQGLLRSEDFEAIERIFNDASTARNNWASKQ